MAHIGVLEELEKQGYQIHSIVGSSMGAVVGGFYAAGKLQEFKEWISNLSKLDVFKLIDFTLFNSGFIKGDKVFEELSNIIQDTQIEKLPIHFTATATDLIGKKEVLFREGSLYDAMRASVAIPNILTPIKKENALLVDGGVINNLPINLAERIDNDLLIAVNVNADIPMPKNKKEQKKEEKKEEQKTFYQNIIQKFNFNLSKFYQQEKQNEMGYFNIMSVSFELMRNKMDVYSLQNNPPDLLIETSRLSCNVYDFYKATELIELGKNAAISQLKKIKN